MYPENGNLGNYFFIMANVVVAKQLTKYTAKINFSSKDKKKLNIRDYIVKGSGKKENVSENIDKILYH